jgi:hypothetical protein
VSGLPAADSARIAIIAVVDTQFVWARNGTTSVRTIPENTTAIEPASVSASDGLTYQAPAQIIAVASRQTTTATMQYAAGACPLNQPQAWYLLDGDGGDASGNGNNGSVVGATPLADRRGMAAMALSFDGIDDRIDLGDRFNSLTLPFTVAAWVYQPAAARGDFRAILATDDELNRYAGIWFMTDATGTLSITYASGGGVTPANRRTLESSQPIRTDAWVHVAATVRGPTDMTLYVDGLPVQGTYSGAGGALVHSPAPARIGSFGIVTANRPWLGGLDDLRIYDCSLTAAQVAALAPRS